MSDALKLTACFGERDRAGGRCLADALLDLYGAAGIALSVLLRGTEGFGLRHALRTDRLLTLSEDLPLVAMAVDRPDRIAALVAPVQGLVRDGLLTLERVRLDEGARVRLDEGATGSPPAHGEVRLTICLGRRGRAQGRPAFVAACALLREHGAAGAVALLGVDGTVRGRRARARFFAGDGNADVPVLVEAVGPADALAAALPTLRELLPGALLIHEHVQVCKRDGVLHQAPPTLPGTDGDGVALWQKLTVHTGEADAHGGPSVHGDIVRELRGAGYAGATTLRGVWGFHGDHPPHGDRLLQLRRHAPAMTVLVDAPELISEAFAIFDAHTQRCGLVTSELVPAMIARDGDRARGRLQLAHPVR